MRREAQTWNLEMVDRDSAFALRASADKSRASE
jgi:hypothetical protein